MSLARAALVVGALILITGEARAHYERCAIVDGNLGLNPFRGHRQEVSADVRGSAVTMKPGTVIVAICGRDHPFVIAAVASVVQTQPMR